jgi:hypothetical protein
MTEDNNFPEDNNQDTTTPLPLEGAGIPAVPQVPTEPESVVVPETPSLDDIVDEPTEPGWFGRKVRAVKRFGTGLVIASAVSGSIGAGVAGLADARWGVMKRGAEEAAAEKSATLKVYGPNASTPSVVTLDDTMRSAGKILLTDIYKTGVDIVKPSKLYTDWVVKPDFEYEFAEEDALGRFSAWRKNIVKKGVHWVGGKVTDVAKEDYFVYPIPPGKVLETDRIRYGAALTNQRAKLPNYGHMIASPDAFHVIFKDLAEIRKDLRRHFAKYGEEKLKRFDFHEVMVPVPGTSFNREPLEIRARRGELVKRYMPIKLFTDYVGTNARMLGPDMKENMRLIHVVGDKPNKIPWHVRVYDQAGCMEADTLKKMNEDYQNGLEVFIVPHDIMETVRGTDLYARVRQQKVTITDDQYGKLLTDWKPWRFLGVTDGTLDVHKVVKPKDAGLEYGVRKTITPPTSLGNSRVLVVTEADMTYHSESIRNSFDENRRLAELEDRVNKGLQNFDELSQSDIDRLANGSRVKYLVVRDDQELAIVQDAYSSKKRDLGSLVKEYGISSEQDLERHKVVEPIQPAKLEATIQESRDYAVDLPAVGMVDRLGFYGVVGGISAAAGATVYTAAVIGVETMPAAGGALWWLLNLYTGGALGIAAGAAGRRGSRREE